MFLTKADIFPSFDGSYWNALVIRRSMYASCMTGMSNLDGQSNYCLTWLALSDELRFWFRKSWSIGMVKWVSFRWFCVKIRRPECEQTMVFEFCTISILSQLLVATIIWFCSWSSRVNFVKNLKLCEGWPHSCLELCFKYWAVQKKTSWCKIFSGLFSDTFDFCRIGIWLVALLISVFALSWKVSKIGGK